MRRTFKAPAKINLCLHVLGRRPDGYHELAMLMQRVALYDAVTIAVEPASRLEVVCSGVSLGQGEENIAARAARLLLEEEDCPCRVEIAIDKQIPMAAGLGGGSSDAAAVLMGLNEMLGLGLSGERLRALGVRLGADVPFFIFGESAWATGVGDVLQPLEALPPLWYVLVNPGVAVSTAWVFQNLGLTSPGDAAKLPGFYGTAQAVVSLLHNDLERVTEGRHPVVGRIKRDLVGLGALGALMSGSGPTVFGVFASESEAREAARKVDARQGWKVFTVQSL